MGSLEQPINPLSLALSAEATFVARTMDSDVKHLASILEAAAKHKGTSFVEVYQNCIIFNPQEWTEFSDRAKRKQNILYLEHGKPLTFGEDDEFGVVLKRGSLHDIVRLGNGVKEEDLVIHNAQSDSSHLAYSLSRMEHPVPVGIFYDVQRPTYSDGLMGQVREAQSNKGLGDLDHLYQNADLWDVTVDPD